MHLRCLSSGPHIYIPPLHHMANDVIICTHTYCNISPCTRALCAAVPSSQVTDRVVKGMEILQIRQLISNSSISGCLLLSGWKIGTITCKHRGNGCGARQTDHREIQVSNENLAITSTISLVYLHWVQMLLKAIYVFIWAIVSLA